MYVKPYKFYVVHSVYRGKYFSSAVSRIESITSPGRYYRSTGTGPWHVLYDAVLRLLLVGLVCGTTVERTVRYWPNECATKVLGHVGVLIAVSVRCL